MIAYTKLSIIAFNKAEEHKTKLRNLTNSGNGNPELSR